MRVVCFAGRVSIFLSSVLCVLSVTLSGAATQVFRLHVTSLNGNGWHIQDADLELAWRSPEQASLRLSAPHLQLPSPLNEVTGITLECREADIRPDAVTCQGGMLQLRTPLLDPTPMQVAFTYQYASRALSFTLKNVALAGGRLNLEGQFSQAGWQLTFSTNALDITRIPAQWIVLSKDMVRWPQGLKSSGKVQVNARISGNGKRIDTATLAGRLAELNFSDSTAQRASEQLTATFSLKATERQNQWQLQAELALHQGQLYIEPIFLQPSIESGQPIQLTFTANWQPQNQWLDVTHLHFDHPGILRAEGQLQLSTKPSVHITSTRLQIARTSLSGLYQTYMQPFLIGTALDAVKSAGHVSLKLNYQRDGAASAQVTLDNVYLDDQQGRYGLHGLAGTLVWTNDKTTPPSHLNWRDGYIYKLTLGVSRFALEARDKGFRLLESATVPVLDGKLQIDSLSLENAGTPQMQWQFRGRLIPVSMESFSQALGWPLLAGELSGVIPRVTYSNGIVQGDGSLQMRVFNGTVTVRNLRLEQPFSIVPQLSADIALERVDLETLTKAFSFGKIQGQLSGRVHGLHMEDWRPVAFEARLATPPDDPSPHQISQKAVDNLSSLGGVRGALSRSFLGFFDEFSYARLGISCRLQKDVCAMDGLEPAPNGGYYIVKGGGLPPRIDVIGYMHRVGWSDLVERLKRTINNPRPEVR